MSQSDRINRQLQLGIKYQKSGRLSEAEACYQQVLQWQRDHLYAHSNLGTIYKTRGELSKAIEYYQRAIELNPNVAGTYNNLANALKEQGKLAEAAACYEKVIKLQPDYPNAYKNLGIALQEQGKLEEAIASFHQALKFNPGAAGIYNNLGVIFKQQGKLTEAIASYQKSIQLEPNNPSVHYNLGNAFQKQGNQEEAIASYRQALELKPDYLDACRGLGVCLKAQGRLPEAIAFFQKLLEFEPDCDEAKLFICINQLRIIYASEAEIKESRTNYQQHLQDLAAYYKGASLEKRKRAAEVVGIEQPFFLPYQGLDDQDLQQVYGKAICQLMGSRYPQWSKPLEVPNLKSGEKIRVGFISGFFYSHSNWKIPLKGWVENLDKNKFELFGYYTGEKSDRETIRAAKAFSKFVRGSLSLEEWCEEISKDNLHAIIFPEFGMDPLTIRLGCLRLAPMQMTSWGHPETSGLPTIDYYLSSDLMEPENAQSYYSEKLVRLPNLSIHYTPLEIKPKTKTKAEIAIADGEILFWCCQSLKKYLPNHDDVFPRIAEGLNKCKFVFIEYRSSTEIFRDRLRVAFEKFGLNYQDYCLFLPRLNRMEFAGTAAIADVFLDSIGWSGCNSALESITHNVPIVTLPGELMRGRHTYAILKMMGVEETIASSKDEYVQIAIRLGKDAQYRQYISQQIGENKYKLYADMAPVKALEDFLSQAIRGKHRGGEMAAFQNTKEVSQTIDPDEINRQLQLGIKYQKSGRLSQAEACYQQVLQWQPDHLYAHCNLGTIYKTRGELSKAVEYYQRALELNPNVAGTYHNLGNALKEQGNLAEAAACYEKVTQLQPDYPNAYRNLGIALQEAGKLKEAIASYERALEFKPDTADIYNNLGVIFKKQGKLTEAIACYQKCLQIEPNYAAAHYNLGNGLKEQGKLAGAIASYHRALQLKPDYHQAKFGVCMSQLKIICQNAPEIAVSRDNYRAHLQNLAAHYQAASAGERKDAGGAVGSLQPFYLAYQGLKDRDLQQVYGQMICQLMSSRHPQWSKPLKMPPLKTGEKIRVGFVSGFFCRHSNWKIPLKGWVENLDKNKFELFGYYTDFKRDRETIEAAKAFVKFTKGPLSLQKWGEEIIRDNLHVIIFPEFGMDSMTVQLGCLRLAPMQMTSWGHPDTSGLPTIDYYLSSDLMEPEGAQEHYSEKLVRLPNLSIYYKPLAVKPNQIAKPDIGLKDDEIMFWCCQSLQKYLPNHDDVFPRIAQDLVNCKFVFIEYVAGEYVTEIFRQRLQAAFEEFGLNYQDYCLFLPRLNRMEFAGTAAIADVFLDSIGWSGCNSTLESITHNVPIVTLPGELMRGRHTYAILKMMGVEETIASSKDEYVQIAIRLGKDAQYRQYISQKIGENKYKLYADMAPVKALEDFLDKAVREKQKGGEMQSFQNSHAASQKIDPDEINRQLQLGIKYQKSGQLSQAEACYQQVLQWEPNHVYAHCNLGTIYKTRGELSKAVEYYQKALKLNPNLAAIYNNLGNALKEQGKLEDAAACYRKVIQLQPDYPNIHQQLAITLRRQGKLKLESLEITNLSPFQQLEFICHNQEKLQLDDAISAYQRILKLLNPHYAQVARAHPESKREEELPVTPPIPQGEITIGGYSFPSIPPVENSEEKRPFWSVVIPVYNRTKYILECLARVLAQWSGFEQMEILVIDDASNPPLFELVNSIGKGIVKYYRNPQNFGHQMTWNTGIALSRGEWIHLLHDDDYVLPDFYSQLKESLEVCPESVGAAFTGYENVNDLGQVIFSKQLYGEHRGIAKNLLEKIGVANHFNPPAVVIRRKTHEQLGVYHPDLSYTPDWEMYKRIAVFYDWWCEPRILARYRKHSENLTLKLSSQSKTEECARKSIEISESYLPQDLGVNITAKARSHYFNQCLRKSTILLKANNFSAAFLLLQEALKIDDSSSAMTKLFNWLRQQNLQYRQYLSQQIAENRETLSQDVAAIRLLEDFLFKEIHETIKSSPQQVQIRVTQLGQLNKIDIKYDSPLIITGMHRSGTSLMTSLFQSAGLNIGKNLLKAYKGNSKGHFENLDFFNFHRSVLHSQGINPDGWTLKDNILPNSNQIQEAIRIIQRNAITKLWGWKDPRTTLFLNFWYSLLPQAYFIFIYRHPLEVVDSLHRRNSDPIFKNKANLAIEMWLHYNKKIVDFCNLYSDKCLLININQIKSASERAILIPIINSKFKLQLNDLDSSIYEPNLLKRPRDKTIKENAWTISDKYREIAFKAYNNLNLINKKLKS